MPFGLPNAAQTFQRFIDEVLRGFDFVYTYIDDLLIASSSPDAPPTSLSSAGETGQAWHSNQRKQKSFWCP